MHRLFALLMLVSFAAPPAFAADVAGVSLPDRAIARDGTTLPLHGAGLREKFFFDIYVVGLYLPEAGQTVEQIRATDQPGRIKMHFVYDELSHEQLADAWREGFADNNPREVRATIAERVATFIDLFPGVSADDVCSMEYVPDEGTEVRCNGERLGTIEGGVFFRALLAVWLGPKPPGDDLKHALLGGT